jgi:hypothetical protein
VSISSDLDVVFGPAVARTYDPNRPETFWNCESALAELLQGRGIEEWVNGDLRNLVANEQYLGDWRADEAVLYRDNNCVLSIALFESPRRYIHTLPFHGMYAPISSELLYDVYRLPSTYRNEVFDPTLKLELSGHGQAPPRNILRLRSDQSAYDFKVPQPLLVLRFVTNPIRPLEWLFSKSSLQAWQANDADLSFTQLRVAAYVLGKIAHQSSIAPLRKLAEHPHHAVRWAAIQNLGRLNRSEALVKIRAAVSDPHPHVRRAAQKTLDRLEGKGGK